MIYHKPRRSSNSRVRGTACAAILAGTLLGSAAAHAEIVDIPVPKATVAAAFNVALGLMKVSLDNFGPKDGTSWHKDASFVLMPGGAKKPFPIPEYTYNVTKWRKLKYYVDEMATSDVQATTNGSRIDIDMHFESQGEEIQAKCIRRRLGKWKECTLDIERDIHLNNTIVAISLNPVAHNGSIAFSDPQVDFKTDVKIANKLCQTFQGICGQIEGKIKNELTKQIENKVTTYLDDRGVKDAVATAVKQAAGFRNIIPPEWQVTKVTSKNNDFIVTVQRPDRS
jgi:hypothetical protein